MKAGGQCIVYVFVSLKNVTGDLRYSLEVRVAIAKNVQYREDSWLLLGSEYGSKSVLRSFMGLKNTTILGGAKLKLIEYDLQTILLCLGSHFSIRNGSKGNLFNQRAYGIQMRDVL